MMKGCLTRHVRNLYSPAFCDLILAGLFDSVRKIGSYFFYFIVC